MSALSQFMSQSRETSWIVTKHVLRYQWGIVVNGLRYTSSIDMWLQGYTDFDRENNVVDRKSTSRCFFTFGFAIVSWCCRKQTYIVLSTAQAEYIVLSVVVCEAVWIHNLLAYLFGHVLDSIVIHFDNQICVKISDNPVFHDKSKHIDIKYHYIRYMVQRKRVLVQYLPTNEKVVDVLTKPLTRKNFKYFHEKLGLP